MLIFTLDDEQILLKQSESVIKEAVPGAARLSVTAGKRVLVENHRGLLEYGPERIVVKTEAGKLVLSGSGLGIRAMDRRDLLIGGKLQCAEWE